MSMPTRKMDPYFWCKECKKPAQRIKHVFSVNIIHTQEWDGKGYALKDYETSAPHEHTLCAECGNKVSVSKD